MKVHISNRYNYSYNPFYFEWDILIPTLDKESSDILNERLSHISH